MDSNKDRDTWCIITQVKRRENIVLKKKNFLQMSQQKIFFRNKFI